MKDTKHVWLVEVSDPERKSWVPCCHEPVQFSRKEARNKVAYLNSCDIGNFRVKKFCRTISR